MENNKELEEAFNAGKYLGFSQAYRRVGSYNNFEEWIKLKQPLVISSVCPFCNSKETEENQPTRHCRYCNQDYGQTDL